MTMYWPTLPRRSSAAASSGATGIRAPFTTITSRFQRGAPVISQIPRTRSNCQIVQTTMAARARTYA